MLFEPLRIKNVDFANRVLRSSIGGRMAYYDGTISPAYVHFEKRFADNGVAGIISPTISVNEKRMSPQEYPSLHDDRFIEPLREAVSRDQGGQQLPLHRAARRYRRAFAYEPAAAARGSPLGLRLLRCAVRLCRTASVEMTEKQIACAIKDFADAALRVEESRLRRSRDHRFKGLPHSPVSQSSHQPAERQIRRLAREAVSAAGGGRQRRSRQRRQGFSVRHSAVGKGLQQASFQHQTSLAA